jgi:hypothetical protein
MSIHTTQPLSVYALQNELPKHTASPTNNVCAYIEDLPFTTVRRGSFVCALPSISLFREDEGRINNSTTDGTGELVIDGIPAELRDWDGYRSRMRMIKCRLYLLRCEVLQSTANAVEQRAWAQCLNVSTHQYYGKILKYALKAQQLADVTSNHDLQARSEYWSGRGCGGLCDWGAAASHFAAAMKLDVPNDNSRDKQRQQRDVLPVKKDDVGFLLGSVTRRYEKEMQKKEQARKANHGQDTSPSPTEDVQRKMPKRPGWMPYYEHMTHLGKQQSGGVLDQLLSCDYGSTLNKEEMTALKKRLSLNDGKQEIRKTFSAQEWLIILRGEEATKKCSDSVGSHSSTHRQGQHSGPCQTPSPASSINASKHTSPEFAHNLGNNIDLTGYESGGATLSLLGNTRSPSSDEEDKTPSPPPADLQGRRNVKLPQICTSAIKMNPSLGEAVLGPLVPTDSVMEKNPIEAETGGSGSDEGTRHIGSEEHVGTPIDEKTDESRSDMSSSRTGGQ